MLGKEEAQQRVRHHYQALRHVATGHFDCAGDMIYRRDTVFTPAGQAAVLWVGNVWVLLYQDKSVAKLNDYCAANLRRAAKK